MADTVAEIIMSGTGWSALDSQNQVKKERYRKIISSPRWSPGRAIVLPPALALGLASASALAKMLKFYIKVFYVMGKALSGELSCPCDRSCWNYSPYIRGKTDK